MLRSGERRERHRRQKERDEVYHVWGTARTSAKVGKKGRRERGETGLEIQVGTPSGVFCNASPGRGALTVGAVGSPRAWSDLGGRKITQQLCEAA